MTTLSLNGGVAALLHMVALYRRRRRDLKPYARPTEWLAEAAGASVWGATRREAIEELKLHLGASTEKPGSQDKVAALAGAGR